MFRSRVVAGGMLLAAVAVLAMPSAASAHDELLASTPAAGEKLEAAPTSITLTFSANVLDVGAAIVVADEHGRDWTAGESTIEEGSVTVPVEAGMPEAGYEVRWRVVSSDGHPISGLIPFTVGDGRPIERTAQAPADAGAAATDEGQTAAAAPPDSGVVRILLIGVGGAVVAVALFAVIRFLRRRRTRASGSGDAS